METKKYKVHGINISTRQPEVRFLDAFSDSHAVFLAWCESFKPNYAVLKDDEEMVEEDDADIDDLRDLFYDGVVDIFNKLPVRFMSDDIFTAMQDGLWGAFREAIGNPKETKDKKYGKYRVSFNRPLHLSSESAWFLGFFERHPWLIEEIIPICKEYGVNAELREESGFLYASVSAAGDVFFA